MLIQEVISLSLLFILIFLFIIYKKNKKKVSLPENYHQLLLEHVSYYRRISKEKKALFYKKVKDFLGYISIEGVHTDVTDLDKILVASSAVIPVMGLPDWKYFNLKTVLLYPQTFNRQEFLQSGFEKDTLGMVGEGSMQQTMILSKPALYAGYRDSNSNTGIHEFVHLLDKEDGEVDGLPHSLVRQNFSYQWNAVVRRNLSQIINRQSDIDSYSLTNKGEFLAVVSEYFFNKPEIFKERHGDIYELLTMIFHQDPLTL